MREFAGPVLAGPPPDRNLTDDLVRLRDRCPELPLLSAPADGGCTVLTAADLETQVRGAARGLVAAGVRPGDRVLVQCSTTPVWTLIDYAIWYAGAVSVPAYTTSTADLVSWLAHDSGASAAIVQTAEQQQQLRAAAPTLRTWCVDDGAVARLTSLGSTVSGQQLEERRRASGPPSAATVVYTSGTTGRPRGCVLTHGNLMSEVEAAISALGSLFRADDASTLMLLPLAHVFARVLQLSAVRAGVRLGFGRGTSTLLDDLRTFRPTFVVTVPRLLEKMYTTSRNQAAAEGRGRLFDRGVAAAIDYSRALETPRGPSRLARARHAFYDRLVYSSVRAGMGGRCGFAVTGGASLGDGLAHFFRGSGVTVLEGYGLTETSAAVTVNTPDTVRLGTAGRPLPGVTLRVGDEGELLVAGPQVFSRYWDDDPGTASVVSPDGWLRTGDLGEIDDEGFVKVTGRKRELLVTAGGKSVAPAPLEDRLRAVPLVDQCMVVGDGRPFVAALVTLDPEALAGWARRRDKNRGDEPHDALVARLADDPDVRAEVQAGVDAANTLVSQAEAIRRFVVLPHPWTEEAGHLTPSSKIRRSVVLESEASWIDRLYA